MYHIFFFFFFYQLIMQLRKYFVGGRINSTYGKCELPANLALFICISFSHTLFFASSSSCMEVCIGAIERKNEPLTSVTSSIIIQLIKLFDVFIRPVKDNRKKKKKKKKLVKNLGNRRMVLWWYASLCPPSFRNSRSSGNITGSGVMAFGLNISS